MDILTYINTMNRLYGSEQQVASLPYGTQGTYDAPEPTDMPNWRDLIREEGVQVGPQVKAPTRYNTMQYLQGGRVGKKPGGLVEPGVVHYGSAKGDFRNFLKTLPEDVIKDNTVLDLIKRSKVDISQTNALNVFAEDFKDIKPLRELPKPDKIEVEKLLKGKTGRMESVPYKGEEWYRGSDGRIRIKRELTQSEKLIRSKKAALAHEKIISKFGAFPTGTRDPAKRIWYDLYDSYLKTKIRNPKDPRTITNSRLQLANYKNTKKWTADIAYNKLKFYDTVTKQTFGFKDLEKFMEKHIGEGSYKKLLEPYKQKIFLNTTYGSVGGKAVSLRYALNETLVPGWSASNRLQNTFEIHHPFGKAKNPFSAHLAFFDTNAKEHRLKSNLFKKLADAETLSAKKQIVKTFINEVPPGILTAPGKKIYGEASTFEDLLKQAKKRSGDVRVKTIMESSQFKKDLKALLQGFCGYAGGGRVSLQGGSCPDKVAKRNFLMATNDVAKGRVTGEAAEQIAKNAAKVVGKAGSKSALMSVLGPAGIGLDIAFEVGSIGTDMAMNNASLKEAMQNNWLTGAFIEGTGQEEYHKGLFAKDSSAKPFGTAMDLITKIETEEGTLRKMEMGADRVRTSEEMLGGQKNKIASLYGELDKVARRKDEGPAGQYTRYLALEPGSAEQVAYERAKLEYDASREATAPLKRTSKYGIEQMIKEGAQKRPVHTYGYKAPEKYGEFTKEQLDQALKWSGAYGPYVSPQTFGLSGYEELSDIISNQRKMHEIAQAGGVANMNAGGRVGLKKGKTPFPISRRGFLQWLLGAAGATVAAGTGLIKWGKVAGKGKTVIKAGDHIIQGTKGMPDWFIPLVNRITKEGTDVSKKLATVEREIVHTKKIGAKGAFEGDEVTVYQNLDTGNVRVEYGPPLLDKKGNVIRATNDQEVVHLEYKAGEVIEEGKYRGTKTDPEFSAAESEPEIVNWEGDIEWSGINEVNKVEDLVTPTHELKQFATKKKPTMKEIVENQKKQKYKNKLEKDQMEQIDYIEKRYIPGQRTALDDIVEDEARVTGMADKRELSPDTKLMNLPKEYDKLVLERTKTKKASGGSVDYDNYLPDIEDIE